MSSSGASSSKPRLPPKAAAMPPPASTARMTRQRAATAATTGPSSTTAETPRKPSGLLARGRAELRKVSDKMKEGKTAERPPSVTAHHPAVAGSSSSGAESLKAYLRIRPPPSEIDPSRESVRPYLEPQNDREVLMRAPVESYRPTIPKPSLIFSFDQIFPPSTPQSSFFTTTTLPLVEKLLHGENGLLFAYGVSNSGKTYTISGDGEDTAEGRGLLPRSIDVVFSSIKGLESKANLKCSGLADVEISNEKESRRTLDGSFESSELSTDESVKVDRNFSYAVFISYAEVYNEKIFDLLDSVLPTASGTRMIPKTSMGRGSSAYAFNSTLSLSATANGGQGVLKRRVLQLKQDPDGNGKYISGLNEVRVRTRQDALAVFRAGQSARQVFSTLSNRESSRSHGVFTIKVVRIHNGAPNDPDSALVSRLAFVDLAGSERNKNTGTSGDRLKEAGSINKSLMILGQCLETLRANQQKLAAPGPPGTKKKLALVPFRHSKLTEIFQNFFVGDGRAVMIVNVNPCDTGFDENSHVMRFSAIAREVQTTAQNKVHFPGQSFKRQISSQLSAFKQAVSGPMRIKVVVPTLAKLPAETSAAPRTVSPASVASSSSSVPASPRVTTGRETEGFVMVEEELEVVEESDEEDSEDERDVLVDSLFEQLNEMRARLYEAEMRNASIEVEVREEVTREMQETLAKMHADFAARLQTQMLAGEVKTDRKIDIVARMTPAANRTYREVTSSPFTEEGESMLSAADTTEVEESFTSALDASAMSSPQSTGVRQTRLSDPFMVTPPSTARVVPTVMITRESGATDLQEEREVSQDLEDIDSDGEGVEATEASFSQARDLREQTAESDDVLGEPIDELESDTADESEEEEDDEGEEDEDDEDDEDATDAESDVTGAAEDADEEVVSVEESDASFALSNDVDSVSSSSEEDEPVRRASSVKGRPTASPRKRSPVKKPSASPVAAKTIRAKTGPGKGRSAAVSPLVLRERTGQDADTPSEPADQDEDDDLLPAVKTPKKKRTLGKKILLQEEMDRQSLASASPGGREVRRMVRGAAQF